MHRSARTLSLLAASASALLLASCGWGDQDDAAPVVEDDPALSGALNDQITTDPDLAQQNRADSAAFIPSQDGSVPTVESGAEAIAAARTEALRLVGGPGKMRKA